MKEKTVSRSKAARHPETGPRSKTASWVSRQREDDEAIGEILFILKRFMATIRNDLNVLPLNTAISLLQRALEEENYPKAERSILHHHLRRALLTRYCFFGCIGDLEACFPQEEGTSIVVTKGTTGREIEKVDEVQTAIQLLDKCRQCVDTATLDDIIWVAEETIKLYTEGKEVLRMGEFLILLGNALVMRYLNCLGDVELTYAANKFREAEYLCRGDIPFSYISFTALAHIGWLRATECGYGGGMTEVGEYMGKAIAIDKEGARLFQIGAKMEKEAVETSQLQEAIFYLKAALRCRMPHHPQRLSTMNYLAVALSTLFARGGVVKDVEESIILNREGLRMTSIHHPDHTLWLNNLANALSTRFNKKGAFKDLEECIQLHREALDLLPAPHPDRSGSLNNLALALSTRFEQKGAFQDLEESIQLHRQALDLFPSPHPDRSCSLNNLAIALSTRFKQKGAFKDLEECIQLHRQALDLRPPPHPDRSGSLNNLATALTALFEQKGAFQDLEESIQLHRQALDLRPPPHPLRSTSLNNLATALTACFDQKGAFQDLEESIQLHRQALDLFPSPHPDRSCSLNNLAIALSTRFKQKGAFKDLEESIQLHRQALDLRPPPHPDRSGSLNNLATALTARFKQKGAFQDLEESIQLRREALDLLPPPHPDRSGSLNNLALALSTRFEQKGAFQDLEESIQLHRQALDLFPSPHPDRSCSLSNLAGALTVRFEQKGAFQDLEESIQLHRQALDLFPSPHPDRSCSLNNLAIALSTRFKQKGAFKDLEECIQLHREALDLLPPPHPDRSTSLNNLATALTARFQQKGAFQDLEECIQLHQEALDSRSHPHPGRLSSFINLAHVHAVWHDHSKEPEQLEKALRFYDLASRYETGSLLDRLISAKRMAALARQHYPPASLNAYLYALELLPLLASIDLTLKERRDVLEHSRELVGDVAQCAISQNQFETAVICLSTGRSIFWSQALQLRTSVDELAANNPILAEEYLRVSRRLEQASHGSTDPLRTPLESDTNRQNPDPPTFNSLSRLAEQRRQTIDKIRRIPGFEGFLLPPTFRSLRRAAHDGPAVLLNTSKFGCDAMIMHGSGAVEHIALPDIELLHLEALKVLLYRSLAGEFRSIDDAPPQVQAAIDALQALLLRGLVRQRASLSAMDLWQGTLEFLWIFVVQPVVKALGLQPTQSPRRIWWCPSGSFSSLPIHAAGVYSDDGDPIDSIFQYAVSSYCNSPQDLVRSRPPVPPTFQMTAIIEPEAFGGNSLPATLNELDNIYRHLPNNEQLIARLGLQSAPNEIDVVLPDIQRSSIVHFGCHGFQNLRDPLESYLLLSGGKLTVSRIIKEFQISDSAALAYLSACETAKGDEDRPDESLNLVATMMFAGFRSVVGTMWSIYDSDAPIVADVFYSHLFRHGKDAPPDVRDSAYALHLATAKLREQGRGFRSWVPYVHYGI